MTQRESFHHIDGTGPSAVVVEELGKDGQEPFGPLSMTVPPGTLSAVLSVQPRYSSRFLRFLNHLERPSVGAILINGVNTINADPVQVRQSMGWVPRGGLLQHHCSVAENISTVSTLLSWPRKAINQRADEVLHMVGLEPSRYRNRYPKQLTAVERHLVALGRGWAASPPLVLLDHPFAELPPDDRIRCYDALLTLHSVGNVTALIATEDITEATELAPDWFVLGHQGSLAQAASAGEVLAAPRSAEIYRLIGPDRGHYRLKTATITEEDLDYPPTLRLKDSVNMAYHRLDRSDLRFAVVLDEHGALAGWTNLRLVEGGTGNVANHARRFAAIATLGDRVHDAWNNIAQYDAGWVPVVDVDDRYLGALTPAGIHRALRRAAPREALDIQEPRLSVDS